MDHEPLASDVMSAIEACRPDRHDERLPEVAAVLARAPAAALAQARRRIEGLDRAIVAAIRHAPVPEGLAERVLAHLHAAADATSSDRGVPARQVEASGSEIGTDPRRLALISADDAEWPGHRAWLIRHRTRLVAGASLALAASLLIAVFALPREAIDVAEVHARARELYATDSHLAAHAGEALPTAIGGVPADRVVGWHQINFLERSGYAYELANRRAKATLYVVPLKSWRAAQMTGLGATPVPQGTSGTTVAAWTDNLHVYVLVVKGDLRAFSSFLPQSVA